MDKWLREREREREKKRIKNTSFISFAISPPYFDHSNASLPLFEGNHLNTNNK